MPPQQGQTLLDLLHDVGHLGAHLELLPMTLRLAFSTLVPAR